MSKYRIQPTPAALAGNQSVRMYHPDGLSCQDFENLGVAIAYCAEHRLDVAVELPVQDIHGVGFARPIADKLRYLTELAKSGAELEPCRHRLADARNAHVASGYYCVDCGAAFAAADHAARPGAVDEQAAFENWRNTQADSLRRCGYPDGAQAFLNLGSVQWAGWQARAAINAQAEPGEPVPLLEPRRNPTPAPARSLRSVLERVREIAHRDEAQSVTVRADDLREVVALADRADLPTPDGIFGDVSELAYFLHGYLAGGKHPIAHAKVVTFLERHGANLFAYSSREDDEPGAGLVSQDAKAPWGES